MNRLHLMRFISWYVLVLGCLSGISANAQVLPLSTVLQDAGTDNETVVRGLAAQQAAGGEEHPKYQSFCAGETKTFEGYIIPRGTEADFDSTKIAIFSDDGVSVFVDGDSVPILDRFNVGQHLPDLNQSFHVLNLPGGAKWEGGRAYHIRIEYKNTIYTGSGDIDGATLFAYAGGADTGGFELINDSRNGDRVAVAKLEGVTGHNGGTKVVKIKVLAGGAGKAIDLELKRVAGGTGSAVFDDNNMATKAIGGAAEGTIHTITIRGQEISSAARNMELQVKSGGKMEIQWAFTVFRVDPHAYISGNIADGGVDAGQKKLPESARNHLGTKLIDNYKEWSEDTNKIGHFLVTTPTNLGEANGGIVIRGKIIPSGIMQSDFNLNHDRDNAFFFDRMISTRRYDKDGCFNVGVSGIPIFAATDNFYDMGLDDNQDARPDSDGIDGDLFIWSFDVPNNNVGQVILQQGGIARLRFNARETAFYARVSCSPTVDWSWASSVENPPGPIFFQQNNDFQDAGDNSVKAVIAPTTGGHVHMTPNLEEPPELTFTLTGTTPAPPNGIPRGATVNGTVTGTALNAGDPCGCLVYAVRFKQESAQTLQIYVELIDSVINEQGTVVSGKWQVNNVPESEVGLYDVKVFIKHTVNTVPNGLKIDPKQ